MVSIHPALNRPEAPVCSVCVANYNGEVLLRDCLDSIYSQQGSLELEIIVHDDASTDGSRTLLAADPRVTWIESHGNVGFCIANNRMVELARGEFVLLLNNDAALHPDAIASLLACARTHAGQAILTLPQFDWKSGQLVDRGCFLDPFYNPYPNLDPGEREVAIVFGACMWLPARLWRELGGFPEWLGSLAEDIWLCCAARRRGVPVRVTSGSGYRHHQGASFGGNRPDQGRLSSTFRRRRMSEMNKTRVLAAFTPAWLLLPHLLLHCALLAFEALVMTLVSRDTRTWTEVYGPALATPWRDRNRLRTERAKVRAAGTASGFKFLSMFRPWPRKLVMLLRYGLPRIG